MNRNLVIVLAAIAVLLFSGIGTGIYFLYHSSPQTPDTRSGLFSAVPPDAVAAMYFTDLQSLAFMSEDNGLLVAEGKFSDFILALSGQMREKRLSSLKNAKAVLSYHYDGRLVPLLAVDASRSGTALAEDCGLLRSMADSLGVYVLETDISRRHALLISTSELLIDSSRRHIAEGISILSVKGFTDILNSVQGGKGQLYISGNGVPKLFSGLFSREYSAYSDPCSRIASWAAFSLDGLNPAHLLLTGELAGTSDCGEFVSVYQRVSPAPAKVAEILPASTVYAFSQPMGNVGESIAAYAGFADSRIGKNKYDAGLDRLANKAGVSPARWARLLDLKEVAVAAFRIGNSIEKVLLLRIGKADLKPFFTDREFAYSGFASALFGNLFSAGSEKRYTVTGDWIIVGDEAVVGAYADGKIPGGSLSDYMADSGCGGRIDSREVNFLAYASLKEVDARRIFLKDYANCMASSLSEASYVPAVLKVSQERGKAALMFTTDRVFKGKTGGEAKKPEPKEQPVAKEPVAKEPVAKTPVKEQEVKIEIPEGPFKVKNSNTGKINTFYQNAAKNVCLKDEKGKQLWEAKLGTPLCGRAGTIDYYGNGKLQILFASGSKIYLIDRLGRSVKGFPVDLGRQIVLGPDIYDFNNLKRYNIMVLHNDNTIEMYNLKGVKHKEWKGIHPSEPVTGLPELLKEDGKSFWVVRTASHKLTYPFYGGEPVKIE